MYTITILSISALLVMALWGLAVGILFVLNLVPGLTGIHEWLYNYYVILGFVAIWVLSSCYALRLGRDDKRLQGSSSLLSIPDDNDPSVGDPKGPDGQGF